MLASAGARLGWPSSPGAARPHKLIDFWKKDQWELFDLVNDPFGRLDGT